MASSDAEMVAEVRSLTGYTDTSTFSDSDVQEVIDIAKEEIRSYLNVNDFTFYVDTQSADTHDADRALFWMSCIGLKIRAGEIGSADISISSLERAQTQDQYSIWFNMLFNRLHSAAATDAQGASSTQIQRDGRSYDYGSYDI